MGVKGTTPSLINEFHKKYENMQYIVLKVKVLLL